ncbi:hypothetical protein [Flavobacterium sharifuzzamanii]|uniref:hypothetical protein n=1 Tax=Flavobacterium sharifuzzamanii TaxID=2211133 RepID=UPI0013009535|nr:hypothetical protein [Flavobacterium sharifuzzamanii]KAF2081747.1 hypothetical protein DMA14_08085 [Flavobacterium sharifuzzamanii]
MKKIFFALLLLSVSNNLLSQSVHATVSSGAHLVATTDWSKFNTKNILVEKVDGTKKKIYTSPFRAFNPTAMLVEGIDSDFEQGSYVKVYVLKPKRTELISTPIQATVNSGPHLEKTTDWSIYSGRNILVEEINGMNQNVYKTTTSWNYNPNAMAVPSLENDYPQGTAVNVYIIEDLNFLNNNVGIGTNVPAYKLDVCGTIRAKEIKVDLQGGCDFVFEKDYKLLELNELESYVTTNKHLPEIDSEKTMIENGLNMKDFQLKLLQKIEELTLYTIQQNKEINNLKKKVSSLESKNKRK